ncbi:hypothetical protein CN172_04380 [Sinorhizobium meliloti]|uniref:helix-turn-helix domain-containing protein n=1 Tax=Rhizobium meliloti TaxID=382 RepID=UPI000FDA1458|nr:helix-turn-helix domain-containing protein [Sinorhizobium meliloti]RVG01632.1 hypothetical protein CN232_08890 [Sinorhizobium meliloti]RVH46559.1 hypothetical protein CN208_07055 [Sinorhizobium meliloti]RVK20075.1 hypothetical protein CN172_04380 [Sinorhizobium meliloti]
MAPRLEKGRFRVMPDSAFEDTRLSATDYRVLAAIAFYDRGGSNGRGCYATQSSIAKRARCHRVEASRSIGRLVEFGHLRAEKGSGKDARRNTLIVLYGGEDERSNSVTYSDEVNVANPLHTSAEKCNSSIDNHTENQRDDEHKDILLNAEGYAAEAAHIARQGHAAEAAPFLQNAVRREGMSAVARSAFDAFPQEAIRFIDEYGEINAGGFLALMDRRARSADLSAAEIEKLLDVAEVFFDSTECGSAEYGLAYRLIQTEHQLKDQLSRAEE